MGCLVILVTILAFIAWRLRNELALTLFGTILLLVLAYCFLGVFFLGLVHRGKARSLSISILNDTVSVHNPQSGVVDSFAELLIKTDADKSGAPGKFLFWRLPAILVRCELRLETRDNRVIRHYADPGRENYSRFPVKERGAYYGECDWLVICDAPGFFRLSIPLTQSRAVRLFAVPRPAEEHIPLELKSGGTELRNEPHYRKSDELTDHRPYIPGDDPRRINWKLYSHAPLGELFVREGEPEPPPHSRLLVMIDTEADSSLYTMDEARRGVDLLCENALATALEFSDRCMDIQIAYTNGGIIGGREEGSPLNRAELASALARPAVVMRQTPGAGLPAASGSELPNAPGHKAVLVFALPRAINEQSAPESSALDRFLEKREAGQETDIFFIYDGRCKKAAELEDAARGCVGFYGGRSGVHAGKALGFVRSLSLPRFLACTPPDGGPGRAGKRHNQITQSV